MNANSPRITAGLVTRTKRYAARQAMEWLVGYLRRDTERAVNNIFSWGRRLAIMDAHRRQIGELAETLRKNPAMLQYVRRLATEVHPAQQRGVIFDWFVNNILFGVPTQYALSAKLGFGIPNFILLDPTEACNLRCTGCWAGEYAQHHTMEFELLDRIVTEAKELGIYWIVLSGGEPLVYKRVFDLFAKHPDVAFMAFTNGTMIDDRMADRILEVANFVPCFSMEGFRESTDGRRGPGVFDKIAAAMDRLKERQLLFGTSVTITRNNVTEITSDAFIDWLISKGAFFGWSFHYIPIGRDPDVNLMVTPEQREYLVYRIREIRTTKPYLQADFWNDGHLTNGCIAGGRRYFHILASGDVEPCAFAHFSVDNIKEKSLLEVLANPLFRAYQKRQPFHSNHLLPCPIIDNPQALRDIVAESGAHPTHAGAETVLSGSIAAHLDRVSSEWERRAAEIQRRLQGGCTQETPTQGAAGAMVSGGGASRAAYGGDS
ncbi:MAG TPA: radical SAM protein [Firmicutes bacterium]|nr:radical SAM protein [Bacillota bacterium]